VQYGNIAFAFFLATGGWLFSGNWAATEDWHRYLKGYLGFSWGFWRWRRFSDFSTWAAKASGLTKPSAPTESRETW